MQWTHVALAGLSFLTGAGCGVLGLVAYRRHAGRSVPGAAARAHAIDGALDDLARRERELATVAANLPDIISRFDPQHRCRFVSPRVEHLTGKPPAFFIGKTYEEFGLPPILAARWRAVLDDVLRNRHAREFDYHYVDQYGVEKFLITRAVPFFDAHGAIEAVFTISTDNTERERTARQLRANGVQLEQADLRKNEYLATLAHELRGPLAPISSAAQLIKLASERAVRERAREVIERQVAQLSGLVNDLMEVGRITSGKLDIALARVTLQQVLDQAIESTRPLLDAKQQPLTCALPDAPVWLDADAMRLTQVFGNLLTNASKYSPPGAAVSIAARVDGEAVAVRVCDEGVGLSDSAMRDIFGLFVQVHATGTQAQGGLGIGLNLVQKLVELHQGRVTVASEGPNRGSCFTVTLPVSAHQPAQEPLAPPAPVIQAPLTVLVVDDNVDGATTLALLLEALGHTAITAFNGFDAVARAADTPVDMAFVDLGLPDISGIQVALRIRGTPAGRKLPLIALTGLGRDDDRYMTEAAQFDEHVVKPLQMTDLVRITEAVATRRQAAAAVS